MACDCNVSPYLMLPSCKTECDKKKSDTKDSDKKAANFDKILAILGIVIPAVPGIILANKGKETGVPDFGLGGGGGGTYTETPAEKAAREKAEKDAADKKNSGMPTLPMWAWGIIGVVGICFVVLIFKAFANNKTAK